MKGNIVVDKLTLCKDISMTVIVKNKYVTDIRMSIGFALMNLGAKISPFNVAVEFKDNEKE